MGWGAGDSGGDGLPGEVVEGALGGRICDPGTGAGGETDTRLPGLLLLYLVVGEWVVGDGALAAGAGGRRPDPLAAGVVGKGGAEPPGHDADEAVLSIIHLGIGRATFHALCHIAIGVVGVGRGAAAVAVGGGMFVGTVVVLQRRLPLVTELDEVAQQVVVVAFLISHDVEGGLTGAVGRDEPVLLIVVKRLRIQVEGAAAAGGGKGLDFVNVAHVVVVILEVGQRVMATPMLDGAQAAAVILIITSEWELIIAVNRIHSITPL